FAPLAEYARQVMEATGLKRCPFHMEVMLTPSGPRMIEVGARFAGLDYVYITNEVHNKGLDAFDMATHHWLSDAPYAGPQGNWEAYDRISFVQLDGVAHQTERVYSVEGVEAIEALPTFRAWVFKPRVGQMVRRTIDLYTIPYSFQLKGEVPHDELMATALAAEKLLRINAGMNLPRRLWVDARENLRKVGLRGQWLWMRARGALGARLGKRVA
ncbi:MAG TPA: hypothetical protein VFH51_10165, partial [Myxococcota bacterium]|nr:hypothetical protein [Myxococcota bacterium]